VLENFHGDQKYGIVGAQSPKNAKCMSLSFASLFEEDDGKQSTCSMEHLLGSFASLFEEADKHSTCSVDHLIGSFASLFEVACRQSICSTHSLLNQSMGDLSVNSDSALSNTSIEI
jgi:hypothetical protein